MFVCCDEYEERQGNENGIEFRHYIKKRQKHLYPLYARLVSL